MSTDTPTMTHDDRLRDAILQFTDNVAEGSMANVLAQCDKARKDGGGEVQLSIKLVVTVGKDSDRIDGQSTCGRTIREKDDNYAPVIVQRGPMLPGMEGDNNG